MKKLLLTSAFTFTLLVTQNTFAANYGGLNDLTNLDLNNIQHTTEDGKTIKYNPDEAASITGPDGHETSVNTQTGIATNGPLSANHDSTLPSNNLDINDTNYNNDTHIQGNYQLNTNQPTFKNSDNNQGFYNSGKKLTQSGGEDIAFYLAMLMLFAAGTIMAKKRNLKISFKSISV